MNRHSSWSDLGCCAWEPAHTCCLLSTALAGATSPRRQASTERTQRARATEAEGQKMESMCNPCTLCTIMSKKRILLILGIHNWTDCRPWRIFCSEISPNCDSYWELPFLITEGTDNEKRHI